MWRMHVLMLATNAKLDEEEKLDSGKKKPTYFRQAFSPKKNQTVRQNSETSAWRTPTRGEISVCEC